MRATITPRKEMSENWAKVQRRDAPPVGPASQALPRALNLDTVLDLGNMVFFMFRGRAYGIPPLAWREGERILDAWLEAKAHGTLDLGNLDGYFRVIERLQRLLWRNLRPTGPVRRLLYFLRLHRNPFLDATEGEITTLALFMLGRRMSGGDLSRMGMEANRLGGTS